MASPAITQTVQPLEGLRIAASGPPELTGLATAHLRYLGARTAPEQPGPAKGGAARLALSGGDFGEREAAVRWSADRTSGIADEATAQAATGIMAVHGRRDGAPRGLAVDYAAAATGVLTVQGLLAALVGQARGGPAAGVRTSADRAGLLVVSQYLAAAGADEGEAAELAPGGPPFTSADGTLFELETLDPGAWAAFWRALEAPADALRAGWRPFQFRYATACAPFPDALHTTTRAHTWQRIREAAALAGAEVCRLRTLAERAAEHAADHDAAPWELAPYGSGHRAPRATPTAARPLAGLTVLEAGRRIQAPLAAHLLGLLGADVVRIEPPGGDPLRGMPPACSGISARWLALNRGKRAVEIDIKSGADRRRLLGMAAGADVFLHNWAPGKAAELGLDHTDLAAVNPALVYAYTSGWGTGGRIADAPMGTDFMVQARTAVGEAARPRGEAPAPSLMTLLDVLGGLLGTEAVLAGLLLRERTGRGVRVDSSLLGASDVLLGPALRRVRRGEQPRRPAGFRRPLPTADGWIAPADSCAAAAAAYDLTSLPTGEALAQLRAHGLTATAVTTDPADLRHDPRFTGSISRDAHGAPTVPDPWSFA
ncbi:MULTISPECIES: CoA transferase [unclassified Streptomyces]|uniref:CoA transferase n=1 Tax=unclassified Streptomyces TaxID=2593676 RepID=UPI002250AEB4|nr:MULTISPECIES: CoA transferase [unclassified Streptomyces]MCX4524105.1 CoA transferase [Streptomyces sp. NBC_01551]MCX4545377.1 CoA transferase [Streptomyces sp. NBC_01565]